MASTVMHIMRFSLLRSVLRRAKWKLSVFKLLCTMIAAEGSFLEDFYRQTAALNPTERGKFLEDPPSDGPDIDAAHEVWLAARVT